MKSRGFTMIEVFVVVAIIGIVAALMIPALAAARDKTKEQEALQAIADNAPPREIERMEYVSGGGETKEFKTVVHWVDGTTTILDGLVQNYAQKGYLAKLSRVDGKFAIVQAGRAHVKVKVEAE